jgi:hypothetical protein
MWKGTADYLFGNPYPYGGRRDDDYGYERYWLSHLIRLITLMNHGEINKTNCFDM